MLDVGSSFTMSLESIATIGAASASDRPLRYLSSRGQRNFSGHTDIIVLFSGENPMEATRRATVD